MKTICLNLNFAKFLDQNEVKKKTSYLWNYLRFSVFKLVAL